MPRKLRRAKSRRQETHPEIVRYFLTGVWPDDQDAWWDLFEVQDVAAWWREIRAEVLADLPSGARVWIEETTENGATLWQ